MEVWGGVITLLYQVKFMICRKFIIFGLVLAVLYTVLLSFNTVSAKEEEVKVTITYFYENVCGYCNPAQRFNELYNELVGTEKEDIEVDLRTFNIFHESGREKVNQYYEEYGVPQVKRYAPIVFIGSNYLVGNDDIVKKLKDTFVTAKEESILNKIEYLEEELTQETNNYSDTYDNSKKIREDSLIVYFYVTACGECQDVAEYFDTLEKKHILNSVNSDSVDLSLIKFNIGELQNIELIKKYYQAYDVPENDQLVPVVFIGDTYLQGIDNIKKDLIEEIRKKNGLTTLDLTTDYQHNDIKVRDLSGYQAFGILITGLINGLNPCSISMLLFFLSMLLVKNINVLRLGLAFIAGKFVAYFLLGTLFFNLFVQLDFLWFPSYIKIAVLIIVLFLVVLNLQDYIAAKNEKYSKIRLQLPMFLRKYNHMWIKRIIKNGEGRLIIPLSFSLGVLISIGEFLCTGQIYLATIIYVLQKSKVFDVQAIVYFLLYGLALIAPLLLLTILIHKGREVFDLTEFIRGKMHIIKLINAIVFIIFGIILLIWF